MKKILALSVAFALMASAVFAQMPEGLKISGRIESGIEITGYDAPNEDGIDTPEATVRAFDHDSGAAARLRLQFDYEQDNWGLMIRLQSNLGAGGPNFGVANYMAFANLFNDILRVNFGVMDYHPYRMPGFYGEWTSLDTHFNPQYKDMTNRGMFLFEVKPIEQLSIGFNFADTKLLGGVPAEAEPYVYARDSFKTATAAVAFQTDSLVIKTQFGVDSTDSEPSLPDDTWFNIAYGAKYTVGDFTVALDGAVENIGRTYQADYNPKSAKYGAATAKEKDKDGSDDIGIVTGEIDLAAAYNITDALKVQFVLGMSLFNGVYVDGTSSEKKLAVPVMIMPSVEYAIIPAIKVGLGAAFNIDPAPLDTKDEKKGFAQLYGKRWADSYGGYRPMQYDTTADDGSVPYDGFSAVITPYANFGIGGSSVVIVYDQMYVSKEYFANVFGVNVRFFF